MSDSDSADDGKPAGDDPLIQQLHSETAIIVWSELIRHFARGVVVHVTCELDLVETAACMARDDTETVSRWLASGALRRASDDDARDWSAREAEFWCVVTAPWVLVQEKRPGSSKAVARPTTVH